MAEFHQCPQCRGYNLERQWCDLCKGAGMIRNEAPRAPSVADIRTFADVMRDAAQQVQADAGAVYQVQNQDGHWIDTNKRHYEARLNRKFKGESRILYTHPSPAAESDKRDAERYRWLRGKGGQSWHGYLPGEDPKRVDGRLMTGDYYDSAVDAAMSREQSQEKGGERG